MRPALHQQEKADPPDGKEDAQASEENAGAGEEAVHGALPVQTGFADFYGFVQC